MKSLPVRLFLARAQSPVWRLCILPNLPRVLRFFWRMGPTCLRKTAWERHLWQWQHYTAVLTYWKHSVVTERLLIWRAVGERLRWCMLNTGAVSLNECQLRRFYVGLALMLICKTEMDEPPCIWPKMWSAFVWFLLIMETLVLRRSLEKQPLSQPLRINAWTFAACCVTHKLWLALEPWVGGRLSFVPYHVILRPGSWNVLEMSDS